MNRVLLFVTFALLISGPPLTTKASGLGTSVGVVLSVSPESAQIGTAARITVENIGEESLTLIELSVVRPSGYRDVLKLGKDLAPGEKFQFDYPQDWLEGSVTDAGEYRVELHVQEAIIKTQFTRNPPPKLSVSRDYIDFGSVRVNSTDSETFTIYNKGGGDSQRKYLMLQRGVRGFFLLSLQSFRRSWRLQHGQGDI